MKQLEKIEWKFKLPDHNCKCAVCNGEQAGFLVEIGNFRLPVCAECGKLDETELLKRIGGHHETLSGNI